MTMNLIYSVNLALEVYDLSIFEMEGGRMLLLTLPIEEGGKLFVEGEDTACVGLYHLAIDKG